MKMFYLILLIFSHSTSYGKSSLSIMDKIIVAEARTPVFTPAMIKHLKTMPGKYDVISLLAQLEKINSNFKYYPNSSTKSILNSHFFKVFFKQRSNYQEIQISTSTLTQAKNLLKKDIKVGHYTEFTRFFIGEALLSYEKFTKDNYLNNYLNKSNKKFNSPQRLAELKKVNKFVGIWLRDFLSLAPHKFQHLLTKQIFAYISSLEKLSNILAFNFQTTKESPEIIPLFDLSKLEQFRIEAAAKNKESKSKTEPNTAENLAKQLDIEPTTGASEKIDEVLKQLEEKPSE